MASTWSGEGSLSQLGPCEFRPTGPATSALTGVVDGHTDLRWHVSSFVCSFGIAGPGTSPGIAESAFDKASQELSIDETGFDGDLTAHNVIGCFGAISNGDPLSLTATLQITSLDGPINYQ